MSSNMLHLGEYVITPGRQIGRGSCCVCYRGSVLLPGEKVARSAVLKKFDPALDDGDAAARFRGAWALQHRLSMTSAAPYIVKPLGCYLEEGSMWAFYEDDGGVSLDQKTPETTRQILTLMQNAALALDALHRQGILYMDVQPSNFLWTEDLQVKLFDFDSAADLKALDGYHAPRGAAENMLRIPELLKSQCFDQNKQLLLRPAVDVYGLGVILFWLIMGRYPTDADRMAYHFAPEMRRQFSNRFRGQLSAAGQEALMQILRQSMCENALSRYPNAGEMAAALESLLLSEEKNVPATQEQAMPSLMAAWFTHTHPLFRYPGTDGALEVALVGDHPIGMEFFRQIFSCAQLTDPAGAPVGLNFFVICPDPSAFVQELETAPGLAQRLQILQDAEPFEPKADAFARVILCRAKTQEQMIAACRGNYILLLNNDPELNVALASELMLRREKSAPAYFLGIGDLRGDGMDPRTVNAPRGSGKNASCRTFAMNGICTKEELTFMKELEDRALKIHTYYEKEMDQRRSAALIRESFADEYNFRSSLRSALSMDYKLHLCGLSGKKNAAAQFQRLVSSEDAADRHLLSTLMHMEHRSWQCFMLTEGWECPTLEQVEKHAFTPENPSHKFRIGNRRYHPCLVDSAPGSIPAPLQTLTPEQWRSGAPFPLDPLDEMSLLLHRRQGKDTLRDYKASDLDVLRAIPVILGQEAAVVIYKLYTPEDLDNVACAVLGDPRELILLYDDAPKDLDARLQRYREFFALRGSELRPEAMALSQFQSRPCAVLDITGADPVLLHRAMTNRRIAALPMVYYREGKMRSYTDLPVQSPNRWLSRQEVQTLYGDDLSSVPADMYLIKENV